MSKQRKSPCDECPFRKKSLRGYLGPHESSREITAALSVGVKFPCHKEVNKRAKTVSLPQAVAKAEHCVGALQMLNNSFAISRNPVFAAQQELVGKNKDVFMHQGEFAAWHDDPQFAKVRAKILKDTDS